MLLRARWCVLRNQKSKLIRGRAARNCVRQKRTETRDPCRPRSLLLSPIFSPKVPTPKHGDSRNHHTTAESETASAKPAGIRPCGLHGYVLRKAHGQLAITP